MPASCVQSHITILLFSHLSRSEWQLSPILILLLLSSYFICINLALETVNNPFCYYTINLNCVIHVSYAIANCWICVLKRHRQNREFFLCHKSTFTKKNINFFIHKPYSSSFYKYKHCNPYKIAGLGLLISEIKQLIIDNGNKMNNFIKYPRFVRMKMSLNKA